MHVMPATSRSAVRELEELADSLDAAAACAGAHAASGRVALCRRVNWSTPQDICRFCPDWP